MKYLGIDYGSKRVGVALSDDRGMMAFPKAVLPNNAALMPTLVQLVRDEQVDTIVVGHSQNLRGGDNPVQEAISEFIGDLTLRLGIPVHLEPEWYTTQEAVRYQGHTELKDASAAAIILNQFLSRTKD